VGRAHLRSRLQVVEGRLTSRALALLTVLLVAGGCGPVQSPAPIDDQLTRYAVQWHGFVGQRPGDAIRLQAAFIDVREGAAGFSEAAFTDVLLLGDRDPIPAHVEAVAPGHTDDRHRALTVALRLDGLQAGRYELRELSWTDETGARRMAPIGTWTLDIADAPAPPLELVEIPAGATSFKGFEVTFENAAGQPVAIEGFGFELPDLDVAMTMETYTPAPASTDGAPVAVESGTPVGRGVVPPGEQLSMRVAFDGAPGDAFVQLQPWVEYTVRSGDPRRFPLPMQIYAPGFDSPQALAAYLSRLPLDAHHRVTP
jgi:hypothetical protein